MGCFKTSKQNRSYSWQDGPQRQRVLTNTSMPNNSLLASPSTGELSLATEPTGRFRSPLKLPAKWLDNARRAFSRYGNMGNLTSSTGLKSANKWRNISDGTEDGENDADIEAQRIVDDLKSKIKAKEEQVEQLEAEVDELNRKLERKQEEVTRLNREVHKLKSVLQVTRETKDGQPDILATVHDHAITVGNLGSSVTKKQGVSGESANSRNHVMGSCQVQQHDKDFRSKQLIKDAIMDNDFLKNLVSFQVREIVDCMYGREVSKGSFVIREGEPGCHLFVSADGELEVLKDGQNLGKMGPGKAFGELAILYNCTRTASVRAVTNAQIWVLDRRVFQTIMMRTGLQRQEENINFLRSVPLLQNLSNEILAKMADVLEVDFYPAGEYIVRQGATGDTFFIISNGKVKVTQNIPGTNLDEEIRILQRGEYFGEQALLREDRRTASVIALEPGVECLALDRDSFNQLIGELQELQEKHYNDDVRQYRSITPTEEISEYDNITLDDLDVIATLGIGGFGRVELVQYIYDKNKTFALKCLQKQYVLDTHQQEHVFSEKNIMMKCRNDFICRMYKTFTDRKYIYMLMEACLGGEVWSLLRDRGSFDDQTTRFYTACVIEALEYLHGMNIIYRDLKPENLLLDNEGYVKLVDFGFSKIIKSGQKTWTFCGTPEYVAPEIILNKGHDRAVDYWSIGIMMYELFTGSPPFMASDPLKTYNIILKGIDFLDFPRNISRTAQSLIKRLCRETPTERLGYQKAGICDIKKHKWFQGFDWDGLRARRLVPPIKPKVTGPTDASNFDIFPRSLEVPPDETSGWDKDF